MSAVFWSVFTADAFILGMGLIITLVHGWGMLDSYKEMQEVYYKRLAISVSLQAALLFSIGIAPLLVMLAITTPSAVAVVLCATLSLLCPSVWFVLQVFYTTRGTHGMRRRLRLPMPRQGLQTGPVRTSSTNLSEAHALRFSPGSYDEHVDDPL